MRNIWQIIVGVVVIGGIGIGLYNVFGDKTAAEAVGSATGGTASSEAAQMAQVRDIKAEETFANIEIGPNEYVLGNANAPITIVEYASLTCSHCATFHNDVLPTIKSDFIASGKVRLVYRDFPLDRLALAASMLARCSGRESYFGFIDVLFRQQPTWSSASSPLVALSKIARVGGMTQETFQTCMKNQEMQKAILEQRLHAAQTYRITGTPTLIINGGKYSAGLNANQMRSLLAKLLAKS